MRFGKVDGREEGRHGRAMPWGFARLDVMKVLSDLDLYYLVVLINSNEIDIEITTPRDTCERGTWRARTGVAYLNNGGQHTTTDLASRQSRSESSMEPPKTADELRASRSPILDSFYE